MRNLTENDYKVFFSIIDKSEDEFKGLLRSKGVTRSEIEAKVNLSYSKIRTALITLEEYGFIAEGVPKGKFKTVYVTEKGLEELASLNEEALKIKGGNING